MLLKEIWIFAEYRERGLAPMALELMAGARKLAGELNGKACACILGSNIREYFPLLCDNGAEKIYFLDHEIFRDHITPDIYTQALQGVMREYKPLMMIFDASSSGMEIAARMSWKMGFPLITEVKRIDADGEDLVISRSCFEGKVYQNARFCPERTVILTVLPQDMDSEKKRISNQVELIELEPCDWELDRIRTRWIGFFKGDPKKISIEEADIIVSGGRGIGKEISVLEELADILGASVGGTRPLVDEGIVPFERQIGITGKSVAPRVLFTFGVSGAREFLAGTEKAKTTIAINRDEKAPIFKNAELKVRGDLKEIIPALVDRLREKKGSGQ